MRRAGGAIALCGLLILAIPVVHRAAGGLAQQRARSSPSAPVLQAGALVGRIAIPRVSIDLAVFEGTTDSVLRKGPGHLVGTAWPGRSPNRGNCVIAGHRDSFFRELARVRVGDLVTLSGPAGPRSYRLVESRIVSPEDVGVAGPTPDERLTLVSCYPFTWTGPAPYRIVWTGEPVSRSSAPSGPTAGAGTPERTRALR